MLSQPEEEDQTETFKDVPDADDAKSSSGEEEGKEAVEAGKVIAKSRSTAYDSRKRDPQFANAQTTCLWELVSPLVAKIDLAHVPNRFLYCITFILQSERMLRSSSPTKS